MKTLLALTSLLAVQAIAQTADVRFIPPAPTDRTSIAARVHGIWPDTAVPRCGEASPDAAAKRIRIEISCIGQGGGTALTPWSLDVFVGVLPAGVYDVEVVRVGGGPMKRTTLIVQESQPAFDVTPNVGAASAPERVRLVGAAIGCPRSGGCAEPVVRFGDQTVAIQAGGADFLEVQPIRGTGTVDVTVTRGDTTVRRVAAFHFFEAGARPAPEFFTPVLFPVLFSARGAFGSEWDTRAVMRNENDFPVITPFGLPFLQFPIRKFTMTLNAKTDNVSYPNGFLSYVPRRGEDDLHFTLLVRDLSRQAEALGTEVPVVREDDFYDRTFSLLNIPSTRQFRVALRVYAIDGTQSVRIRVRPMATSEVLVDDVIRLASQSSTAGQDHLVASISDILATYPALVERGPLRIEVLPPDNGSHRIWAFASITNNVTQHVTVISPQ